VKQNQNSRSASLRHAIDAYRQTDPKFAEELEQELELEEDNELRQRPRLRVIK